MFFAEKYFVGINKHLSPSVPSCVLFRGLQGLGFDHVLMSGSGSTIFCIGSPERAGSWTDEFAKKWEAMVIDTHFINRPVDDNAWYAEG